MSTFLVTNYLWGKGKLCQYRPENENGNRESNGHQREMICRICTSNADIPITKHVCFNYNILDAIRTLTNSLAYPDDRSPEFICQTCFEDLKIALIFKWKCESAQQMFNVKPKIYERDDLPPPPSFIKHDFASMIHKLVQKRRLEAVRKQQNSVINIKQMVIKEGIDSKGGSDERKITLHRCKPCDLEFVSKDLLLTHQQMRNCVRSVCVICGSQVINLQKHMDTVHSGTCIHTCHICGKVTNTAGALKTHLLIHSDKFEYTCKLCPYKGKQKAYLVLHMRTHTGERPYLCSKCPLRFTNASNLRKHQLTHFQKRLQCKKCGKSFHFEKHLREHFDAAHLNVRYQCSICNRELWSRTKLLRHQLRVHKREKHKVDDKNFQIVVQKVVI